MKPWTNVAAAPRPTQCRCRHLRIHHGDAKNCRQCGCRFFIPSTRLIVDDPPQSARIGNGAKDDAIRALLAQGMPQQEIAAELGISRGPVQRVAKQMREEPAA
jgi:CRP-like cAMP-binding protein